LLFFHVVETGLVVRPGCTPVGGGDAGPLSPHARALNALSCAADRDVGLTAARAPMRTLMRAVAKASRRQVWWGGAAAAPPIVLTQSSPLPWRGAQPTHWLWLSICRLQIKYPNLCRDRFPNAMARRYQPAKGPGKQSWGTIYSIVARAKKPSDLQGRPQSHSCFFSSSRTYFRRQYASYVRFTGNV